MLCYAKSLQSCPTLCDPIDGSPPGSYFKYIMYLYIIYIFNKHIIYFIYFTYIYEE